MKLLLGLILFTVFSLLCPPETPAQNTRSAAQTAEQLRLQLLEIQSKEASLQARLKQLDEDLIPENIEHSLAGVGSTRPEDLRAQRRRELESEKAIVEAQLKVLESSRDRLSATLRMAEAAAYYESAQVPPPSMLADNVFLTQASAVPRWMVRMLAVAILLLGVTALISLVRKP